MNFIWALKKKLHEGLLWSFKESEPYFLTFGIAVLIGVLGFYFLNKNVIAENTYENFSLRLLSGILVMPLIFNTYWPSSIKHLKFWYWYFVLIYTLPFFFSFMLLMNPASNIWHINGIICFVILALFVDWVSFLLLLTLGVVGGVLLYAYSKTDSGPFIPISLRPALYSYLGPIIYIILFSRKKEKIQQEKIHTMKMLAGSIAHELRTPLSSMMMGAKAMGRLFPLYQDAYKKAKKAKLATKQASIDEEKYLVALPQNLQIVSQNAQTMITMLLTNLNEGNNSQKTEVCPMRTCVEEALSSYPFSPEELKLIHWQDSKNQKGNIQSDFSFLGHKDLTKHVLFNLLKNALYAIASAGKGEIYITVEPGKTKKDKNRLIFKDTGVGISPEDLRHIFDRFYSKTEHGTGVGLAFCQSVIKGFGGGITCTSQENEHTTFTITLPVIKNYQD
jgi:signal transduction histidine kinase